MCKKEEKGAERGGGGECSATGSEKESSESVLRLCVYVCYTA